MTGTRSSLFGLRYYPPDKHKHNQTRPLAWKKVRHISCITLYNTYDSEPASAESCATSITIHISPTWRLATPSPTILTTTDDNSIATLNLQQHATRILDVLLDLHEELHGLPAVKQTVVVGQRQVHHRSDLNLSVDSNWLLLDGVKPQHSSLGKVDNGGTHQRTEDTTIADSESSSCHILNRELAVTGLEKY